MKTEIPHHQIRYYNEKPEKTTLLDCYNHGRDHRYYGWSRQIDPRWTQEQIDYYQRGYDSTKAAYQQT